MPGGYAHAPAGDHPPSISRHPWSCHPKCLADRPQRAELDDLRVTLGHGNQIRLSAESAFRANSSPAAPTASVTLRDGGHGSGVWPPSTTTDRGTSGSSGRKGAENRRPLFRRPPSYRRSGDRAVTWGVPGRRERLAAPDP